MNPHTGIRLSVAIAQNGIFLRCFAACTYTGSGVARGGAGGAGAAVRGAGPVDAGAAAAVVAGAEAFVVAGVLDGAESPVAASSPWPIAERRSRDRLRRCSGISVTAWMIDGSRPDPGISRAEHAISTRELMHNHAQSAHLRARLRSTLTDD